MEEIHRILMRYRNVTCFHGVRLAARRRNTALMARGYRAGHGEREVVGCEVRVFWGLGF